MAHMLESHLEMVSQDNMIGLIKLKMDQ